MDWIKAQLNKVFSWRTFFWAANLICMIFSAQNAGFFFGLYEPLGLAVAFVIDLAIIVFMQAMLAAKARGESSRANWIVGAIVLCALLSTVGNIVHNLQVQDVSKISHLAPWFQSTLPFISSSTPMLLVIFALVADLVTKSNPLDSTNLEEYKAQEEKRLQLLSIQIENRYRQVEMKQRLYVIVQMEKSIKSGANVALPSPRFEPEIMPQFEDEYAEGSMPTTDPLGHVSQEDIITAPGEEDEEEYAEESTGYTPPEIEVVSLAEVANIEQSEQASQANVSVQVKRQYTMTFDEAATYTGYTVKHLKSLANAGKIEMSASGKLKVSSLQKFHKS